MAIHWQPPAPPQPTIQYIPDIFFNPFLPPSTSARLGTLHSGPTQTTQPTDGTLKLPVEPSADPLFKDSDRHPVTEERLEEALASRQEQSTVLKEFSGDYSFNNPIKLEKPLPSLDYSSLSNTYEGRCAIKKMCKVVIKDNREGRNTYSPRKKRKQ